MVSGRKVFITKARESKKMLLLARTTPYDQVDKKTMGISLFFADIDPKAVEVRELHKCGRKSVDTNMLFIDNLYVPKEDLIGEEGKGFYYILDGINPERILIASECIGMGKRAIEKAVQYSKERIVFGRPIGMNQGIQFPLADSCAKLETAELMVYKAAWLYDQHKQCGKESNIAKYMAAEAACEAADRAMQAHGGYGYIKDYDVERYWREARLFRIAPISQEMILNYVGEHVLGLPKSY
jgi:acyl-CoA dehydrogenase